MKKIILIVGGIIIVAVLGRVGWAYFQVSADEAKMADISASTSAITLVSSEAPSDNGINFETCIYDFSATKATYGYGGRYSVKYPNTWENKNNVCEGFISPDDQGRWKDFMLVEIFETNKKLLTIGELYKTGQILYSVSNPIELIIDGQPALQNPKNKQIVFTKDTWVFTLRKGDMTSDSIFERFAKSFQSIN